MKIWLDVMTPKQARLMHCIYSALKDNHEFLVTSRKSAETQRVLEELAWKTHVIGSHGQTLKEKAEDRFQRQIMLTKVVADVNIDLLISHVSPSATHVAYALGIPIILTNDTPWASHVNTLTLPFADYLVCSIAFAPKTVEITRKNVWAEYCMAADRIKYYNGVDEVAWVKNWLKTFEREKSDVPVITIRISEHRAAYAKDAQFLPIDIILREIDKLELDIRIQLLSRYLNQQLKTIAHRDDVTFIDYLDPLEIYRKTTVFIGYGGTMNREAALLGIPSISLYYYENVNPFVTSKGFPLYKCDRTSIAFTLEKIIASENKHHEQNFLKIIDKLESSVDPIVKLVAEFGSRILRTN